MSAQKPIASRLVVTVIHPYQWGATGHRGASLVKVWLRGAGVPDKPVAEKVIWGKWGAEAGMAEFRRQWRTFKPLENYEVGVGMLALPRLKEVPIGR